jgi:hypothetical protein
MPSRCRAKWASARPRLALLDVNPHCLQHTRTRLAHHAPEVYQANALAPLDLACGGFESIGINYVLHCMPGTMAEKRVVFANLKPLLRPGGTLFGSTVLRQGVACDVRARAVMRFYNARGVFRNLDDSLTGLQQALQENFRHVRIDVFGCVAQFSVRK